MENNPYLSIIVPAYNEENRISKTLEEIDNYIKNKEFNYEIIVISDGSKDNTADVVNNLKKKIKNLVLINNIENHGKGYVVRQALTFAKGDYRLFTDADNSTPIEELEKMIPFFDKYHIIIGSRAAKGATIKNPQPISRRFVGKVFNLMVQSIVGLWGIWDTQCGFKVLSKEATINIIPLCKIDRWAFDPEILKIAKLQGYKIKEVPIVWINDLETKVRRSAMIKMAIDLFTIRKNLIKKAYNK